MEGVVLRVTVNFEAQEVSFWWADGKFEEYRGLSKEILTSIFADAYSAFDGHLGFPKYRIFRDTYIFQKE